MVASTEDSHGTSSSLDGEVSITEETRAVKQFIHQLEKSYQARYKIPVIENLGATLDQFDTLDLSDNDIRKLDGFPLLKRLKCILLNNNRVVIAEGLENYIPNLETLILTGNLIQELADVDPLMSLQNLTNLSLMHCPIAGKQHYRQYIAFKFPKLRLLDFRKIKMKEREEAVALFKSKRGREIQREIAKKAKTFVPGAGLPEPKKPTGPSAEELWKIREAISNASSLEEVERLNRLLQAGQIPGKGIFRLLTFIHNYNFLTV
ncbi:U2 small nuclear ribonucleoprotein A' [Homalodisca vitripennis]|nr:U2 small nuclear ribonucleoprotein A' [Homalodisca vitripennis]